MGWLDVYQLLQRLHIAATACVRIESANEPAAAEAKYSKLRDVDEGLRQGLVTSQARMTLLEAEAAAAGDEPEPDAQPAQVELPAELQQARDELQAVPMAQWSEEQVIAWVEMLGLPPASLTAVEVALRDGMIDCGEELQGLTKRRLVRSFNKVQTPGAADAESLADQVLEQRNAVQASASSESSPWLR
jgi:hypothetical protein